MTSLEWYMQVFETSEDDAKEYLNKIKNLDFDKNIAIEDNYLKRITAYLQTKEDLKERKTCFKDIVSTPNMDNGKVYEFLAYAFLQDTFTWFKEQVDIESDECLKKNPYKADGKISNSVVFDIKKFGIEFPLYDQFRKMLQDEIDKKYSDYHISLTHFGNIDTKVIEKELIGNVKKIVTELMLKKNKIHGDYIHTLNGYNIKIRAHDKQSCSRAICNISENDITQWAKENELYFFSHASQFCCNQPYMLICPFIPKDLHFPNGEGDFETYFAFRLLCRRMFMNLTKQENRFLTEFDGKAKNNITLATAAKKLSAVMFIDISYEEWDYINSKCWVYLNPNADFPIPKHIMTFFNNIHAHVDSFYYDNY